MTKAIFREIITVLVHLCAPLECHCVIYAAAVDGVTCATVFYSNGDMTAAVGRGIYKGPKKRAFPLRLVYDGLIWNRP